MTTAGDIAAGSPSPFSIGPPPGAGGWEWVACNQLTTG